MGKLGNLTTADVLRSAGCSRAAPLRRGSWAGARSKEKEERTSKNDEGGEGVDMRGTQGLDPPSFTG